MLMGMASKKVFRFSKHTRLDGVGFVSYEAFVANRAHDKRCTARCFQKEAGLWFKRGS